MTKVTQAKEKDFDDINPKVGFTDMSDEQQNQVFEICREAYSTYKSINKLFNYK
jgi:hypothetical protein